MGESEFTVRLFSNSSMDCFPSNSLTRFTVNLSNPLYLSGSYSVALTEIDLPPRYDSTRSSSSRDRIVFDMFKYGEMYKEKTLANFANCLLRSCSSDPSIYGISYFAKYLDPSIVFDPYSLFETFKGDETPPARPEEKDSSKKIKFYLELDKLVLSSESNSEFLPSISTQSTEADFLLNGYVEFSRYQRYTMRQILFATIEAIVTNLRIDMRSDGSTIHDDIVKFLQANKSSEKPTESLEKALNSMRYNNSILAQRFIMNFVGQIQKVRDEMTNEKRFAEQVNENFVVVYSDVVSDSYFASTKAKILSVFPISERTISKRFSNPDFARISNNMIRSISIIIGDEHGRALNLQPSVVPSYVALKFKRT